MQAVGIAANAGIAGPQSQAGMLAVTPWLQMAMVAIGAATVGGDGEAQVLAWALRGR